MRAERASTRKPVEFFCVGAQKAGTTTMHDTLVRHAQIYLPEQKETKFFADDSLYSKGIDYYERAYFSGGRDAQILGEVDPEYLYFPYVADRIHRYNRHAKIIVLLRNPIDRAYSHYLMSVSRGFETLPFAEALRAEAVRTSRDYFSDVHFSYASRGLYHAQVSRFIRLFGAERVRCFLMEDLAASFPETISAVCEFLEVDGSPILSDCVRSNEAVRPRSVLLSGFLHRDHMLKRWVKSLVSPDGVVANAVRYVRRSNLVPAETPPMSAEARQALQQAFRADTERLCSLLDRDLGHWLDEARDDATSRSTRRAEVRAYAMGGGV